MRKFWNKETGGIAAMLAGCFLAGMAFGVLFGNLAYPYRGQETDVLGMYLLEQMKEERIVTRSYFYFLLEQRMKGYLFLILAGFTSMAKISAVGAMALMGFLAGAGGSMGILQLGVKGVLFFMGANLPQGICYIPSFFILGVEIYRKNGRIWTKSGEMLKEYMGIALLCLLGAMGGVLLETYVNPFFLSWMDILL
ncbi:MAG: stage II sporulation protein M [Oliverpabstia sp.]|nr:stage II sporulation protein M [Oliverpabstia sp.]